MHAKERLLFQKKRSLVISELKKVEKKYGQKLSTSAMRKYLQIVTTEKSNEREMRFLQERLDKLRKSA